MSANSNAIRVAIVFDGQGNREHMRTLLETHDDIEIIAECADGAEALRTILDKNPDLIFLDVQAPNLDTLRVVEAIEHGDSDSLGANASRIPPIVVVAAHDSLALKAFEIHALDFLLKPFDNARLEKTLARVRRHVRQSRESVHARLLELLDEFQSKPWRHRYTDRLVVRSGKRILFLRADEIDWIEAAGNHLRLHAGDQSHLLRATMRNVEKRLAPRAFVRIHRSAIVNIDRIRELTPWFHGEYVVTMHDGTRLSASRVYCDRLNAFLDSGGLAYAR